MQKLQEIFKILNPPQKEAAEHLNGAILVLAGAGTGKTRVLTTRLANLIATGTAAPHNILAVTFTNKAAKEMRERVEDTLGAPTAGMWMGTFHAIGARLLRKHAELIGLKPDFTILDTDDQKRLLDELLKAANIDTTVYPPRVLAGIISRWKDKAWNPVDVPKDENDFGGGKAIGLYAQYQARLGALNACDFGDLLLQPLNLFKQHPHVLAHYQNQLTHVLVDEYQDTNTVQYLWLRLITITNKNICVVGDDDQSIYGWRGAQVENILKFEKDFDGAKVVRLEQNYRSTAHILSAASKVIGHNETRHGKTLWTDLGDGEKIHLHPVMDDREEARMVADACDAHARDGSKPYTDLAVLVRAAAQMRSLEEQFIKTGVPYTVVGGPKFYERKEIRDAIAYLRLFSNHADDLAFERIINLPRRGVGQVALNEVKHIAARDGCPLLAATHTAVAEGVLAGKAKTSVAQFMDQLTAWQNFGGGQTPDRLCEQILEETGYLNMLREDKDPDAKTRLDNLKELLRALQDYADIPTFLEHVALVTEGAENDDNTVKLMTIHAAKGLEFDTVFLPGFEDGLFPHQRSLNETGNKGIEEERRLAYVAITRAKRKLHISYTFSRRMYGQITPSIASRFLAEIPEALLEVHTATANVMSNSFGYRPAYGSRADSRSVTDYAKPAEPLIAYENFSQAENWDDAGSQVMDEQMGIGSRVFHHKFGYGRIQNIEGDGEAARLTISFEKAGTKSLVAGLAKLQAA